MYNIPIERVPVGTLSFSFLNNYFAIFFFPPLSLCRFLSFSFSISLNLYNILLNIRWQNQSKKKGRMEYYKYNNAWSNCFLFYWKVLFLFVLYQMKLTKARYSRRKFLCGIWAVRLMSLLALIVFKINKYYFVFLFRGYKVESMVI